MKKTCLACAFAGVEPCDMDLVCHHPDTKSPFGLYIRKEPLEHCPDFSKFVQHPGRTETGALIGTIVRRD